MSREGSEPEGRIREYVAKAERSLEVARSLLLGGHFDFAASRAYYAMFYTAEAMLGRVGLSYSSHAKTIGAFGREFARTGKLDPKHHRRPIDAEKRRNTSDYDIEAMPTPEAAEESCIWAEEFLSDARAWLDESASEGDDRPVTP